MHKRQQRISNPEAGPPTVIHITTVPFSLFFFRGQVRFMSQRGVDFQVVSSPGPILDEFAERNDVPVYGIPMVRQITPLHDLVSLLGVARVLRDIRPEIVHSHTPKGGLLGMIAAKIARVPVRIYHIRGLPHIAATGYRRYLLKWSEWVSCRLADEVLCVGYSMRDIVVAEGLCPPEKIKVLGQGSGNGVDARVQFNPDKFDDKSRTVLRALLGIEPDALTLGFVGRIVRDKGIEELAASWSVIRSRHQNAHLVLVGPIEPQDPISEATINNLTTDERVHIIERVENPSPWYSIFDLVVLPTYREGFPNVPLEAAAMELPIVATNVPGCVDAVVHGVTGLLVPPRDIPALTIAIERYLGDPELRHQHGFAGRERVLQDFRQEVIWEAIYQEYRFLLIKKGLGAATSDPSLDAGEGL